MKGISDKLWKDHGIVKSREQCGENIKGLKMIYWKARDKNKRSDSGSFRINWTVF